MERFFVINLGKYGVDAMIRKDKEAFIMCVGYVMGQDCIFQQNIYYSRKADLCEAFGY